ncbi:MAG TPA: flagellar protein FliS [Phycisphaerales bacterium]|nr:flagellar protein FliS [Phycisphaerales bacterium]
MSAENPGVNAYLRTKVMTAPPEQLRLLLIEGAIKFTRQGVEAMRKRDWEGVFNGYCQARNILLELSNSVRMDVDPDLGQRVQSLYMFMYMHLVESSTDKDIAKGEKVLSLLEYERETWVMLLDKLQQEKNGGAAAGAPGAHAAPGSTAPPTAQPSGPPAEAAVPVSAPELPRASTFAGASRRTPLSIQG